MKYKIMKNLTLALVVLVVGGVGCSTSSHKATGDLHPAVTAESVTVYYAMPANAKVIGTVTSDSYGGLDLKQASATAVTKLQEQAAKLGANGIFVNESADKPLDGAVLTGQAIFVSPPKQ